MHLAPIRQTVVRLDASDKGGPNLGPQVDSTSLEFGPLSTDYIIVHSPLSSLVHRILTQLAMAAPIVNPTLLSSFHTYLATHKPRILVVCGAGLSAASGLPTFRGAGGHWKTHNVMDIATPEAFERDPVLVWRFYQYRRRASLAAQPNAAHHALAAAAERLGRDRFYTITQNVDGLSKIAGHPDETIEYIHGNLMSLKCFLPMLFGNARSCGWREARHTEDIPIPDEGEVGREVVPKCPGCGEGIIRPGVVWFGEALEEGTLERADEWIWDGYSGETLCLVIGTSGQVFPANKFSRLVRGEGGKVAVVDIEDRGEEENADWSFVGDAAKVVPEILKPLIEE